MMSSSTFTPKPLILAACLALLVSSAAGFQSPINVNKVHPLYMSTETPPSSSSAQPQSGYVPKWKKKKTLADDSGDMDYQDKGIKGTIPVVFRQGEDSKSTMAMPGQPLRDVATQAGQFIKYGCGKGECGTCEAMCDGKWVRPCKDVVPAALAQGQEEVVITVKDIANKSKSSGKFFSIRSFFMGFWNNVLGMVGFVKYRRNAKENWQERQEYEDLIRQKTLEKKRQRQLAREAAAKGDSDANGNFSP